MIQVIPWYYLGKKGLLPLESRESRLFMRTHAEMRVDFGRRLRLVRGVLAEAVPGQHSQKHWRDWLRVPQYALSKWENGIQFPPPQLIADICWATGVSADYLLFGVISDAIDPWLASRLRAADPDAMTAEQLRAARRATVADIQTALPRPMRKPRRKPSSKLAVVPGPQKTPPGRR